MATNNSPIRSKLLYYITSVLLWLYTIPGFLTLMNYLSSPSEDAVASENTSLQLSSYLSKIVISAMKMETTCDVGSVTQVNFEKGVPYANYYDMQYQIVGGVDADGSPVSQEGILEILGKVLGGPSADTGV